MRNYSIILFSLIVLTLVFVRCKSSPTGDSPPDSERYELTVNISPNNANGQVSPDGGSYNEGEKVTITASAEENWQFESWEGSGVSSNENPLEVTMTIDRTITANFFEVQGAEVFTIEMTVSDGTRSKELFLISSNESGINNELDGEDTEGPPIAPPNAFFVGIVNDGMNLYTDARQAADRIEWEIRLNRALTDDMQLEWSVDKSLEGNLMLVDSPDDPTPAIEIDMLAEGSHTLVDPGIRTLYIKYTNVQPARIITNVGNEAGGNGEHLEKGSPTGNGQSERDAIQRLGEDKSKFQ